MITAVPQIPPIPGVAIGTGRIVNGVVEVTVAREWWRWFTLVATMALAQQGSIDQALESALIPADASPDAGAISMATFASLMPQDRSDPDEDVRSVLKLIAPPEEVSGDQIAMRSMVIGVPA